MRASVLSPANSRINCPVRRATRHVQIRAVAAPEMIKKGKKACKDSLYLFSWHRAVPESHPGKGKVDTKPELQGLVDQLKTLEKVSKDAVWFSVKDSSAGQHVLVVTNDMKKAKKYCLKELTGDVEYLTLEGMTEPVEIPVASLKAALQQGMIEDDSSDSSEDEDEMMKPMKMKSKDKVTTSTLPATVEENASAALQAQALLTGTATPPPATPGKLGDMAKSERKKLKDAVKEVDMSMKASCGKEDDSSCSSEEEENDPMKMQKKQEKEIKKKEKLEGIKGEEGKKPMTTCGQDGEDSSESDSSEDEDGKCEKKDLPQLAGSLVSRSPCV